MPVQLQMGHNEMPEWMRKEHQELAAAARALGQQPYQGYDQRQRVPGLNDEMKQALDISSGLPYDIGRLEYNIMGQNFRKHLMHPTKGEEGIKLMSPFINHVLDRNQNRTLQRLENEIMPSIAARFLRLGQHGSSRHANFIQNALQKTTAEMRAEELALKHHAYEDAMKTALQDRLRHLEATKAYTALPGIKHENWLRGINRIMNAGLLKRDMAKERAELEYREFLRQQEYPYEMLSRRAGIIHGIPHTTSYQHYVNTPRAQQPRMDIFGQVGAGAANLMALKHLFGL